MAHICEVLVDIPIDNVLIWALLLHNEPYFQTLCHFLSSQGQNLISRSFILSIYVYQDNALKLSGDGQNSAPIMYQYRQFFLTQ